MLIETLLLKKKKKKSFKLSLSPQRPQISPQSERKRQAHITKFVRTISVASACSGINDKNYSLNYSLPASSGAEESSLSHGAI
jgi:hypothetical protein